MLTDSIVSAEERKCNLKGIEWSQTTPSVDLGHIFCGKINSKGRAGGYHHREGGVDSSAARIQSVLKINNKNGVYISQTVSVLKEKKWIKKKNISSFFPDVCTYEQVVNSIVYSAKNIECRYPNGKWAGKSSPIENSNDYCLGLDGKALMINGYWHGSLTRKVATAWPLIDGKNSVHCK